MRKQSDDVWREARRRALRQLARTTDEEDAEITAAASRDPDNPPWPDEKLACMRPAIEVMPEIVAAYNRRRRGPQKAPTKQLVSIRLDRDVIAYFRKRGLGWQGRINDALRKVARLPAKARAGGSKTARTGGITKSSRAPQSRRRPPRDR
jgi:uncharacterized protein (DUF4415 family)